MSLMKGDGWRGWVWMGKCMDEMLLLNDVEIGVVVLWETGRQECDPLFETTD